MDAQALKKAWLHVEQEQASFIGWDFSYLDGKYEQEPTPWCYEDLVRRVLTPDMHLLDMGTGGGERLATFHHPWHLVSVTEGWDRNYRLLLETLRPKGVDVQFVGDDQCLNFADHSFDIVLNAHESFQISEVRRVLKPGGFLVTQQVGDLNGIHLASRLIPDFHCGPFDWHLSVVADQLEQAGFTVRYADEAYPWQKFFDMAGLIYYVKTIAWEFPGFSVATHMRQLLALNEELGRKGYVSNQEHRFILVAKAPEAGWTRTDKMIGAKGLS